MKLAQILILTVALGAGFAAYRLAGTESDARVEVVQERIEIPSAEVLVAARDISLGTPLKSEDLRWSKWPLDSVTQRAITREAEPAALTGVAGAIARASFVEGEPISQHKLARADHGFMSAILPKGMRAVSTQISPETGAGGFILPNDRVDVVLTRRGSGGEGGGLESFTSETILSNVRVLAIDQALEEQDGRQVVVGKTATLELRPEQTEILALADQLGELSLALRSLEDSHPNAGEILARNVTVCKSTACSIMKFSVSNQVTAQ